MSIKCRLGFGLCFVAFLSLAFITLNYVAVENQIRRKTDNVYGPVSVGRMDAASAAQHLRAYGEIETLMRRQFAGTVGVFFVAMGLIFLIGRAVMSGAVKEFDARKKIETEKNEVCAHLILTSRLASVGELAAGLCHEVGNQLQTILGNAELVIYGSNGRDSMYTIKESALAAKKMLSGLLDFSHRPRMSFHKSDVRGLIEATLKIVARQMELKNIEIIRDYSDGLPDIKICPDALQQVFLNIILNAQKAMPDGGKFFIRAFPRGDKLNVIFKDTGKGIKKEQLPEMFKPFFTTFPDGHGLGLGVSRRIIDCHGGKIRINSEGEGLGAEVGIELPVDFNPPEAVTTS